MGYYSSGTPASTRGNSSVADMRVARLFLFLFPLFSFLVFPGREHFSGGNSAVADIMVVNVLVAPPSPPVSFSFVSLCLFVFVFVRVCVYLFMIYLAFTVFVCVCLTLSLCDGCRGGRNEHVGRGQVPRPVQAGKLSHTCTCTHTSMYARTHAREMRLCTYVHCIYICNNVLMCTPTPTHTHTHTHTHTRFAHYGTSMYTCTHTHKHTHVGTH